MDTPLPGSPVGPPSREMPISRAFFYISFWIPSKEAPPPGSPDRVSAKWDAPFPEPSFDYLSKFPGNGSPPHGFPNR